MKAFEQLDVAKVAHWVVSQENDADNDTQQTFGTHYHMAIKRTRRARWCRVRACLESENGIKANLLIFNGKQAKVETKDKTPSEVTISIGLRKFRDDDLKFVRGSSLPLKVCPGIGAEELL